MSHPSRRVDPTAASSAFVMVVHGWNIYAHPLFIDQFENLLMEVEKSRSRDPTGYQQKKKTKLLAAILKMAFEVIPHDPANRVFLQGNTLGPAYRHWRRGKFFDGRYRLFFRFATEGKVIVLAWINDGDTLRTHGSSTDAYSVFKRMLEKKRPPDDWETLLKEAQAAAPRVQQLLIRSKLPKK